MSESVQSPREPLFMFVEELDELINALANAGYQVVGPTIDQQAIVYGEIKSSRDLPRGWTDLQEAGTYRLQRREDEAYFGYVVGPHSWKKYLFPPSTLMSSADLTEDGWQMRTPEPDPIKYAFLGVRACELAAIRIQDKVFLGGPFVDPTYEARRSKAFIVAVNCTQAAPTCFCTSMNTGPRCERGFDLALTEISGGFLIEIGTEAGQAIVENLHVRPASSMEVEQAEISRQQAVDQITRQMDTVGIHDLLMNNLRHPQWEEISKKCLSCTNCTMVCPTCFCSSVSEVPDLMGEHVDRERHWDSCFNIDFSCMNGSPTRNSISSRYRQWMTHKLATWHDQFGSSGCVGCGRCITWCPVGIDLTQAVAVLRNDAGNVLLKFSNSDSQSNADRAEVKP
jgi:sulfhydrogenase subunit beta (sulfur reductase)